MASRMNRGTLVLADDLVDPLHGFRGKPQVGRLHVKGRATHDGSELVPFDVLALRDLALAPRS
jgi:hypothetical protein